MPKYRKLKELIAENTVRVFAGASVIIIIFIFIFIFFKAWPVISHSGIKLFTTNNFDEQIVEAFFDMPEDPVLDFGLLGLIMGTIVTTGLALLIAVIIGIGSSVFISEISPIPVAAILKAFVRLLASIPSVVFGLVGLVIVVPFIEAKFVTDEMQLAHMDEFQITGHSLLASVIVLIFMIVPTVISLSVDAIDSVAHSQKEVGYALGMSHFRVIWKIILPDARSGIIASITLAAGRGIGEAIAISMVCGGVGITPDFTKGFAGLLAPVLPLASAIVNKSEAISSSSVQSALFACAAILLVIEAILSVTAKSVETRMRKAAGYEV